MYYIKFSVIPCWGYFVSAPYIFLINTRKLVLKKTVFLRGGGWGEGGREWGRGVGGGGWGVGGGGRLIKEAHIALVKMFLQSSKSALILRGD